MNAGDYEGVVKLIKERVKLRFGNQEDLDLVLMVAEKKGLTLEQHVHQLIHKSVLDYIAEKKDGSPQSPLDK